MPASGTNIFRPFSAKPASVGCAMSCTASGSQLGEPASKASVACASPVAMRERYLRFCARLPAAAIAPPASSTVERYGPGSSARPISSSATAISTKPKPGPPYSSSNIMPVQPWSAIFCHKAASYAVSVSIRRRTSAMGHSAEKNFRAEFFNTCCVSVNPNCMAVSSVALGQSQHEMAHDVALDLRRARFDGVAPRTQPIIGPLSVVESEFGAACQLAVWSEQFHGDLLEALIQLAPENLLDGAFRAGLAGFHHAADGAHLVQAHDFDFGVALRQLLPDDRVLGGGASVAFDAAGQFHEARKLALEGDLEACPQKRALVHQRAEGHVPTVVDAAHYVGDGHAHVIEE